MAGNFTKLRNLLAELFMFEFAELDFGIYRIMNSKRAEIQRFLDQDLLPQVQAELGKVGSGERAEIETELAKSIQQAEALGADPDSLPKVKALRERLAAADDPATLEDEVFSLLAAFFRRYYKDGDYLALRRYKKDVYALPYEGEEVKLHWANADQYYIKSSEYFRDYVFKLPDGRRVHFTLSEADSEQNNNKAVGGKERRFVLVEQEPLVEEDDDLTIRFVYRIDPEKQATLNKAAAAKILASAEARFAAWLDGLRTKAPTEKDQNRTLLEKHLGDYTARNSFDYFIHKDLRGFLRRELDFFIKSEVMLLDDIEEATAPRVEHYLAKVRAMRRIAHKIIDMLAQLEEFQKKLWLKKKFVVETNYCVTLDRVPEELYPEIAANEAQREEWVRLFAIDAIAAGGDMFRAGYSVPLTVDFLKANPFLVLDTRFFSPSFKARLLASFDDLDAQLDGLLVHSDNFQALNLLQQRYREEIQCIYIDPPYNTSSSAIPYKNDYRHSSWASLMRDRVALLSELLKASGAIFVSIDKVERTILESILDGVFGFDNRIEELIWSMNTNNSQAPNYSTNHEYVQVYAKDRVIVEQDRDMFREPKPGFFEVMELVQSLNKTYSPISDIEAEIRALYDRHRLEYRDEVEAQGLEWEIEKNNDPWRGLFNYCHAEYRDDRGHVVLEADAREKQAKIWVWRESDASMPATKQSPSTYNSSSPNWRFYRPLHPITGKPCHHPKSGWKFAYKNDEESPDRRSFTSLDHDHRIVWGPDENKIPQLKRMLHEVETNVGKSVFQDYSDGEKQTSALFGRSGVFLAPKHSSFVSRFILHGAKRDSLIVDCFAGSGSTGHAVLDLNREDEGTRKYILVEMGTYFDTVTKPRILKVIYSKDWKDGKPVSREGSSHLLKYIRLESYEDALNNLEMQRSELQARLLEHEPALREDYMLRYMLDVESRGSASLLNIAAFAHPFDYTLKIAAGSVGETRDTAVDLVETFNYLLGLRVRQIDTIRGVVTVQGLNPEGQRVLIIWRDVEQLPNSELDTFFQKQGYTTRDQEFDLIYVNGDNNLENLRRDDETWKVRLIEQEFQRLMFDVRDV